MIITVTPNPSLDRTYEATSIELGEVNRAHATHIHAGGKGINVTRALVANGFASVAVFPSGGSDGDRLVADLRLRGVPVRAVSVAADTRSNVTLVDATGSTTKINAPGEALTPEAVEALLTELADEITRATGTGLTPLVVGAGSLPDGAGTDFYVRVATLAASLGAKTVLDTSGAPLRAAVAAGGLALVKPNDEELAELVGRELTTVAEVVDAAREVMESGIEAVLVSLGAHGALLVTADDHAWAGGDALVPLSTVGAGDTTLAGFLSALAGGAGAPTSADGSTAPAAPTAGPAGQAEPLSPPDALVRAVAWGRAAVLLPGSAVPTPADIHPADVTLVTHPPRHIALKEL